MARAGMDRETGRLLQDWDHCAQSIAVILTTRVGWRLMRRRFGAKVADLQDRNPEPAVLLAIFAAIAAALRAWEPGFRLRRIVPLQLTADGTARFELAGDYYPRGHLGDYATREERSATFGGTPEGFAVELAP